MSIIKMSICATLCLNNCESSQNNFMQMLVTMQKLENLVVNVKIFKLSWYLNGLSLNFDSMILLECFNVVD